MLWLDQEDAQFQLKLFWMLIVLKLLSNVNIPYAWQNVESCDRTCRTGSRKKTRTKTVEAAYGESCSGDASVVEDCNTACKNYIQLHIGMPHYKTSGDSGKGCIGNSYHLVC